MNPLDQLQDIRLPEPVSWWPLAPVWWLLIALLVLFIAALIGWLYANYKRNAYRREALTTLKQLSPASSNARTINALLKATAISCYGQAPCANLYGERWLAFLQQTAPKATPWLESPHAQVLGELGYQTNPDYDPAQLWQVAKAWLQHHQSKPGVDTVEATRV